MLTVTSSTFSGNSSVAPFGTGGIKSGGGATLTNVIVANSASGGDLSGTFGGNNNLIDDASGTLTGTGNIRNTPALLGTLGNNGGMTQTIPLLSGSPAINAGAAVGSGPMSNPVPSTDQRGLPRASAPDIGAFEVQGTSSGLPNPLPNPKPPGTNQGVPAPLPLPPQPSGPSLGVPAPLPSRRP